MRKVFSCHKVFTDHDCVCEGLNWVIVPRLVLHLTICDGTIKANPFQSYILHRCKCLQFLRRLHNSKHWWMGEIWRFVCKLNFLLNGCDSSSVWLHKQTHQSFLDNPITRPSRSMLSLQAGPAIHHGTNSTLVNIDWTALKLVISDSDRTVCERGWTAGNADTVNTVITKVIRRKNSSENSVDIFKNWKLSCCNFIVVVMTTYCATNDDKVVIDVPLYSSVPKN